MNSPQFYLPIAFLGCSIWYTRQINSFAHIQVTCSISDDIKCLHSPGQLTSSNIPYAFLKEISRM